VVRSLAAVLLLAGLALRGAAAGSPQLGSEDEAALRARFAAFDAAFARADAVSIAAGYAKDADIVRPNQPPVIGRAAIESFYREMFRGPMKGVRKSETPGRIRLVSASLAVVDSAYALDRDEPPLHARGASLTVLEKRGGVWLALLSRSYRLP
jgi:uncharacterized protein (TIGR02246 family)